MLDTNLTPEQQQEILRDLFDIQVEINAFPRIFLYNNDGTRFYDNTDNVGFHFSTLRDVINYARYVAKKQGYQQCQKDFKEVLGVTELTQKGSPGCPTYLNS